MYFFQFFPDKQQILKGFRPLIQVTQKCGGMIHCHMPYAVDDAVGEAALLLGQLGQHEGHQHAAATEVHGFKVLDIATLPERLKENPPKIGILCVSNSGAQESADKLVNVGVKYIWNFANVCLDVPDDVVVQREVIAGGLAVLAAKIKQFESGDTRFSE